MKNLTVNECYELGYNKREVRNLISIMLFLFFLSKNMKILALVSENHILSYIVKIICYNLFLWFISY